MCLSIVIKLREGKPLFKRLTLTVTTITDKRRALYKAKIQIKSNQKRTYYIAIYNKTLPMRSRNFDCFDSYLAGKFSCSLQTLKTTLKIRTNTTLNCKPKANRRLRR